MCRYENNSWITKRAYQSYKEKTQTKTGNKIGYKFWKGETENEIMPKSCKKPYQNEEERWRKKNTKSW